MISNGENWHYLVVKNLAGLLKGITSNYKEDFYCLNCFCAYSTKNKLEAHKKYVKMVFIVMYKCLLKIIIQLNITKEKNL